MALPWQRNANPAPAAPPRRRRDRRRQPVQPEEARRQSARQQEEQRRQRLAITIGVMLILAIVAIVAVGYYREFYEPPRVMAGEVRGVRFSMGDLVDRIRVLQGIRRYEGGQVDLSVIPFQYLQNLLQAEILRQAAPGLGLTVTDALIDQRIRDQFYPSPPPGQEADPGQLEREFENNYRNFLTQVRLTDSEFRRIVEEELLVFGLFEFLGRDIPQETEQVEVEWIRLAPDAPVIPQDVRRRLDIEDFAQVAAEVGTPDGFADSNGYVGWVPAGALPQALDQVLFGDEAQELQPLDVGEISDPVFIQEGTYILRLISAPEERELSSQMRQRVNIQLVENWQNQQVTRGSQEGWVRINFDSDRYAWVADQVRLTAPRVAAPQQPGQGGPPNQGR